ncbi:EamA family transporter [Microvirga pudoricolor]|uniref:EamA family transporter n=1 Tax=Microvirga pudoricolor TaxID=2778729 RepID=UPI001950213B|nr:DMT family transporter [Microvirga pudoricolor]MBM6593525.1 DMT family transporter [Microvirga pudoricolor]
MTKPSSPLSPAGSLFALGSAALYGLNIVFARVAALEGANGPTIVVYRVLLMLALMGVALGFLRRPLAVARGEGFPIVVFGLSTAMLGLCYVSSVAFIPVTVAAVIFYAYPVLIVLASPFVEKTRLTLPLMAVVLAALTGVVLVVGPVFDGLDWRGVAMAFGAAIACAVQFFVAARTPRTDPLAKVFWGHVIVLPTALLVGVVTGQLGGPAMLALAPFAVFVTVAGYVVGFLLQIAALARIAPVAAGIIYCLEPVVAALISVAVLGEALTPVQAAGGLLVLAAIVANIILERSRKTPLVPTD